MHNDYCFANSIVRTNELNLIVDTIMNRGEEQRRKAAVTS